MARGKRKVVEEKNYDALIQEVEANIAKLTEDLKAERANLKKIKKDKDAYDRQKEEQEKTERTQKVAEMIATSGKSLEEIEAFLAGK